MRIVVSSSQVPHLWAHQQQEEARNSGNSIFFEGRTIYSYGRHFLMATIDKDNSNTVFFTTESYSVSTAKHLNYTRQACGHMNVIYCKDPKQASEGNHTANLQSFEDQAKYQAMKLPTSRKPENYLSVIATFRNRFNTYVEHFGIAKSKYKKFKYIFIETKEGGTEATAKEIKAITRAKKKREVEQKKQFKIDKEKFLNFETHRVFNRNGFDILRYNKDNERFETSQGVEIPKIAAQRFYNWIKVTLKNGGCSGECTESILNYQVSMVSDKVVKIGCHSIETKHMLEVGASVFK